MKQIIDGLRYDTAKARAIGDFSNIGRGASSTTDFKHWSATLYKTESGRYFLHGEGGPMTRWGQDIDGNSRGWGEHIEPLTPGEAFEWAQEYLDPEIVESIFNEYLQDA
jgi:hypothetical protein